MWLIGIRKGSNVLVGFLHFLLPIKSLTGQCQTDFSTLRKKACQFGVHPHSVCAELWVPPPCPSCSKINLIQEEIRNHKYSRIGHLHPGNTGRGRVGILFSVEWASFLGWSGHPFCVKHHWGAVRWPPPEGF